MYNRDIILASVSARRKGLLSMLKVPFTSVDSCVDERAAEAEFTKRCTENTPYEWVKYISAIKAEAVADKLDGEKIIIAADTIVTYMNKILNKPTDRLDAVNMLKMLSGNKHIVYTGLSVLYKNADGTYKVNSKVVGTDVYFRNLTDEEIEAYVNTNEPFDKAGAYGIQDKGSLLVDHIDGDYFNVVGLPLVTLYEELLNNGVSIMEFWK